MTRDEIVVRFSGTAGDGVLVAGEMLTQAVSLLGARAFMYNDHGAEVRGGPSMSQVRISRCPILSQGDRADILVALSPEDRARHLSELNPEGVLLFDGEPAEASGIRGIPQGAIPYGIPLSRIALSQVQSPQTKNMVALGAFAALFHLPLDSLEEAVGQRFGRLSRLALKMGFDHVREKVEKRDDLSLKGMRGEARPVFSGNQLLSSGALAGGLTLFAGYPITPANEILEMMSRELPKRGGSAIQTEDEISALGVVLGASFAGARAMTATSGPGLSLMVELITLASMAEVPAVIADIQRGGPATGMPTKTEQGDLLLALHGGHGDAPRVVIAPADAIDNFYLAAEALNIAIRLQLPVILLSDQFLGQRKETLDKLKDDEVVIEEPLMAKPEEGRPFPRYKVTESGISPISFPGQPGGLYTATGLEHDEFGIPCYTIENHQRMQEKRFRKLVGLKLRRGNFERYGDEGAEIGVVAWGSTTGAVKEAIDRAGGGLRVSAFFPKLLSPFPLEALLDFLRPVKRLLFVELNYMGQLASLLQGYVKIEYKVLARGGGGPFKVEEVLRALKEMA